MSFWKKFVTFLIGEPSGERARDSKGRFVKDDPSTPNVNEEKVWSLVLQQILLIFYVLK